MTEDEKRNQMTQRNADICAYYAAGHTLKQCASKFTLSRQRVYQLLCDAGVRQPYVKTDRTKFLGVNVTEQTKKALTRAAKDKGISASRFASDVLDGAVAK